MKHKVSQIAAVVYILATVAAPVSAAPTAELGTQGLHHHHRYRVIYTGTLGGPISSLGHEGLRDLNNRGVLVSLADSAIPQPQAFSCFFTLDCFVAHTVEWRNGMLMDVGALGPATDSSGPSWISDSGLVSGFSENGHIDPLTGFPEISATLWQEGAVINLGTFGGNNSTAFAVNNRGQVVGAAATQLVDPSSSFFLPFGVQQSRAFLWQNGSKEDLGTLGGADANALLINDRGQVAGASYIDSNVNPTTGTPTVHPFLWEHGEMKDLGTIGGTLVFEVNHLNESGDLVGSMSTAGDATFHPFLWDGRKLRDIGTLGGDFGNAIWINDAGSVVGVAQDGSGNFRAFIWKDGVMSDLGVAAGDQCSIAYAINASGQTVGSSGDCSTFARNALLWDRGKLINLNAFVPAGSGVQLTEAVGINDRGYLAAQGVLPNGDLHAFLLTPCDDEPVEAAGCSDGENDHAGIAAPRSPRPTVNARSPWRQRIRVGAAPAVIRDFLDARSGHVE